LVVLLLFVKEAGQFNKIGIGNDNLYFSEQAYRFELAD
jgi:hypothetical protein